MGLPDEVLRGIRACGLILPDSTLVIGVSGGTDSLALLHLLAALREPLGIRLHTATLDHGLRGQAGADDARYVVELSQAWHIPATRGYVDVGALARARGLGIEAAARIARYDFLASVARGLGAGTVAAAHQAGDQVETVLLHLLRGSGVSGLAGMAYAAPLPGHPDLKLIRPLLDVPRADLEAYCREHGLQPRHDASNDDTSYTRNRLRSEVIPYLRRLSPQIERRLLQLAEIAAGEDDLVDSMLRLAVDQHIARSEGRISLHREIFFGLHPALQRRFIVWAVRALNDGQEADYRRTNAALEAATRGKVGTRVQFRGKVQLRLTYEEVVIERNDESLVPDVPLLPVESAPLSVIVPGVVSLESGWLLVASSLPLAEDVVCLAVPESSTIILRGRREGDRFAPQGMNGHTRKLSKWLIDHKVPQAFRNRLPLVEIDGEIAAIYWRRWFVSEHFRVTDQSVRIIALQFGNNP